MGYRPAVTGRQRVRSPACSSEETSGETQVSRSRTKSGRATGVPEHTGTRGASKCARVLDAGLYPRQGARGQPRTAQPRSQSGTPPYVTPLDVGFGGRWWCPVGNQRGSGGEQALIGKTVEQLAFAARPAEHGALTPYEPRIGLVVRHPVPFPVWFCLYPLVSKRLTSCCRRSVPGRLAPHMIAGTSPGRQPTVNLLPAGAARKRGQPCPRLARPARERCPTSGRPWAARGPPRALNGDRQRQTSRSHQQ